MITDIGMKFNYSADNVSLYEVLNFNIDIIEYNESQYYSEKTPVYTVNDTTGEILLYYVTSDGDENSFTNNLEPQSMGGVYDMLQNVDTPKHYSVHKYNDSIILI